MIPKVLKIKGLYSYKDKIETVIDFEQLNQAGLFGIFGATGSGKSSIPEAMLLAIYGKGVGRANYQDLMNLDSNNLLIDFEFESNGHIYRRIIEGTRKVKSREVSVETPRTLIKENNEWKPLSKKDGKALIGLDVAEFKKTIIIPQDEFRAFIELSNSKLTEMLGELFDLERFDLREKTAELDRIVKTNITDVEGEMRGIGNASYTIINELERQLKAEKELLQVDVLKLAELDSLKKKTTDLNSAQKLIQDEQNKLATVSSQIIDNQAFIDSKQLVFEDLKKQYEAKETLIQQAKDLRNIVKIKQWQTESLGLKERIAKGTSMIKDEEIQKDSLQIVKKNDETNYNNLSVQRPNFELIKTVRQWFFQKNVLENEQKRLDTEGVKLNERIANDRKSAMKVFVDLSRLSPNAPFFDKTNEAILFAKTLNQEFKTKQIAINDALIQHKTSNNLKVFAESLTDGKPCMLCGSVHHPSVWTPENVENELKLAEQQSQTIRQNLDTLSNIEKELNTIFKGEKDAQLALENVEKSQKENENSRQKHTQNFVGKPHFSPDNLTAFEAEETAANQFNIRLESAFNALKKATDDLDIQVKKIQKYADVITTCQNDLNEKTANIRATEATIFVFKNIQDWAATEPLSINEQAQNFENQYNTLISEFEYLEKTIIARQNLVATFTGQQQFSENQLLIYKNQETQLKNEIGEQIYDAPLHETTKKSEESRRYKIGAMTSQINDLENRKQQLFALGISLKKLLERSEHLDVLKMLFRGDGFTSYVANNFLKNICQAANTWFLKFTKQALQIEVDEHNRLFVRDIMNRGLLRSIDTLSGGQKFQASLSLALALSDGIQSRSSSAQRFFFLDEGFGSLDRESLRIVFDTLNMLRKKGRIVGVISHVEEMQQEISVYLRVFNDETKGSIVMDN